MKRIVVSALCILALLFSIATTAHAEDLSSVAATVNSDKLVTVSGKIDGGAGQTVNIMVRDPNGSLDYLNTCLSGIGGAFSVSYTLVNTAAGSYTVTVGAAGVANVASTSFFYGANHIEAAAVLENGLVKIAGTAGAGAGRLITVRITAPNGAGEYAGYAVSGAGGDFQLSYALTNTQTGKYTVYVGASGIDTPAVCYFFTDVKAEVSAGIDKQKVVTVKGVSSSPGKPMSIQITDPKGKTEYLTGVLTQKDGTFAVSYTMINETKGRYTVSVSAKGLDTPVTAEFIYGSGLKELNLSSGPLNPAFASDTTQYGTGVRYETSSVTVTPYAVDPLATIKVNGSTVKSGESSGAISLSEGSNALHIQVTEPDGTVKTYTINVTRAPKPLSGNADLSGLTVSAGNLSPAFIANVTSYNVNVANSVSEMTVTPVTADAKAAVTVNGKVVTSSSASGKINLVVGSNTVVVKVTAENGNERTYTLAVTRAKSSNASLSALSLSTGTLSPGFAAATTSYTASVANSVSSIQVSTTTADAGATVTVNGSSVSDSGPSGTIGLNVGNNVISVVVKAQDGVTLKAYTITVTRVPSGNANLSGIMLSLGSLNETFAANVTAYTVNVPYSVTSMIVTPALADSTATVSVTGGAALAVGENTITIMVTAQDKKTVKTYKLTVIRAKSGNANLSSLKVGSQSVSLSAGTTNYSVNVANEVDAITVTPTVADSTATIKVNGTAVTSGSTSEIISLDVGNNTIAVTVTAQDGTVKEYTITVTRFEQIQYTVTVDGQITGGTIQANAEKAVSGSTINLTITPNAGWQLKADTLKYNDGTADHAIAGTSFTMPAANVTVTAQFEQIQYTVTVDGQITGGTIQANAETAVAGSTVNLTIVPNAGWQLKAGTLKYNDGTVDHAIAGTSFTMPAANVTVTAQFEQIQYTVTVDGQINGGTIQANAETAVSGSTVNLTIVPNADWQLKTGTLKYNDGTVDQVIAGTSFTMPAANVTVTAQFEQIQYTVTVDGQINGGIIQANTETAVSGSTVNLTITPNAGWQLKAGTLKYNDGIADHAIAGTGFTMPAANVTVTAQFEQIPPSYYTVTVDGQMNGGTIQVNAETAVAGSTINLIIVPNAGWELKAGTLKYNDGTADHAIAGTSFTMPEANVIVTAQFEQIQYTVTVDGQITGGTIQANAETAVAGSTVDLTIASEEGWRLKAGTLKYNDGTVDQVIEGTSFTMPAANVTVTAQFEFPYTVQVDPQMYGGTIQIDVETAAEGTTVNLTIIPDKGLQLKEGSLKYYGTLEGALHDITGTNFTMPAEDVIIMAQFEPMQYTVTVDSQMTGGTIQADVASAAEGTTVYIFLMPDEGLQLKEGTLKYYDGELHDITGNSFIMPAAHVVIMAQFE